MNLKHIFFFILFSSTLYAQSSNQFENISTLQGLSGTSAKYIYQDSYGFLWFGTIDTGLNLYDGYTFKVYRSNPADSTSIIHSNIYSIDEDADGNLWIAVTGGIAHYIRSEDRFMNYNLRELYPEFAQVAWFSAYSIFVDSKNRVWVGTSHAGTLLYDQENDSFVEIHQHSADSVKVPAQVYGKFSQDKNGVVWASANATGFVWFDEQSSVFRPAPLNSSDRQILQDQNVFRVHADSNNDIWLMTDSNVYKYLQSSRKLVHLLNYAAPRAIHDGQEGGLCEDLDGNMWVVHSNLSSLIRFEGLSSEYERIASNAMDATDIKSDSFGNIWVTDFSRGLFKKLPERQSFQFLEHQAGIETSLSSNQIHSICQSNTNPDIFYIGTEAGGWNAYNRRTGAITRYNDRAKTYNIVFPIITNDDGTLWMGFWGDGLAKWNPDTNALNPYFADSTKTPNLYRATIISLLHDKDGGLWIGTLDGLYHVSADERTLEQILPKYAVTGIFKDQSTLWLTTYGAGLVKYDTGTKNSIVYQSNNTTHSLSSNIIWDIYQAANGDLWLSTEGGLNIFNPSTELFTTYNRSDGLASDLVAALLPDSNGNIWLTTRAGISRAHVNSNGLVGFTNYDARDGILLPNFQFAAKLRDETGRMYFGSENGLYYFTPIEMNTVPPKLYLTNLKINGQPAADLHWKTRYGFIGQNSHIDLKHDENTISIDFLSLHYSQPNKNLYSHFLQGYDPDWINDNERSATYVNLKPGDYTLYFRGTNNDGIWSSEELALSIHISPPWWNTWFSYIGYVILFIGALGLVRAFEINRRKEKENKRILQLENQRKSEELERARQLQLSMLPKQVPELPNLDIAVYMNPATEVGGDYYDFHLSSDGTLTVAVGDATGHGLNAGMMVTATKSLFETLGGDIDTVTFMNRANHTIRQMHLETLKMAFTILKIKGNRLFASGAGMPSLLVYRKSVMTLDEIKFEGMPLGSLATFPYEEKQTELSAGDKIILMSDGFPERQNPEGEMLGYAETNATILATADQSPQEIVEHLVAKGENWANGRPQDDDVTFVVIKVK